VVTLILNEEYELGSSLWCRSPHPPVLSSFLHSTYLPQSRTFPSDWRPYKTSGKNHSFKLL